MAFGHPGCPLTCKSQFLMIEFFYGYVENWPPVLFRSAHDTRQWIILRMKRAFSLAAAQRCTKWYPNMAEQEAEQLRNSSRNRKATPCLIPISLHHEVVHRYWGDWDGQSNLLSLYRVAVNGPYMVARSLFLLFL